MKKWVYAYSRGIVIAVSIGLIIHGVFIEQMLAAIPQRGLIEAGYLGVFLPHAILMYCLPPAVPNFNGPVSNWLIAGKILDALPASMLYGVACSFLVSGVLGAYRKLRKKRKWAN